MTTVLALVGFILPLGLDSFAVAAAIGATGSLTARARWRISALFVVFEAGMPLIGLAVGAPIARAVGPAAEYVAAAAVIGIGAWMLLHGEADDEEKAERFVTAHGMAMIGLGLSISMDELAIGFSLGLTHLPVLPVIIGIGIQTLVVAQLGLLLGSRIAERYREAAERLAGIVLIILGLTLIAEHLLT